MVKQCWQPVWLVWTLFLALVAPATAPAQLANHAPPPQFSLPNSGAGSWSPQWSFPARQPAAPPHPAVARIVAPEKNAISYGSGTLVDVRGEHGLVITNWHVVRDATETISVVFPDGFRCAARVLKTDKDWDLAALAVWRPSVEPVRLAAVPPQLGDVLTIAGYGSGDYRAATGRCTQFVAPGERMPFEMVEISTEARQGDSGGPIFNTQGELAGVLFGAGRGTTSGSHAGRVSMFLASLAPDMGRPDVSNIANKPAANSPGNGNVALNKRPPTQREEQSASPPVRPFAPAIVNATPNKPKARLAPAEDYAVADYSASRERLAPVSPAPQAEGDVAWPRVTPIPNTDHHVADFGTPPGIRPLVEPPPTTEKSLPLEARVDLSRPAVGMTWQSVAGDTLLSQIKTVLAAIGVLALFFHGLRLTGKSTPKKKKVKEESEEEEDEDDE